MEIYLILLLALLAIVGLSIYWLYRIFKFYKSGNYICDLPIPDGLFENEIFVDCGRSMLRRFQLEGQTLEDENVSDRLLLTY